MTMLLAHAGPATDLVSGVGAGLGLTISSMDFSTNFPVADALLAEAELLAELAAIDAESIGWLPLEERVYLHAGNPDEEDAVVLVVGMPDAALAGMNVLLIGA